MRLWAREWFAAYLCKCRTLLHVCNATSDPLLASLILKIRKICNHLALEFKIMTSSSPEAKTTNVVFVLSCIYLA